MATSQPQNSAEHWQRSIQDQMAAQRQRLRGRDPAQIAQDSGARWAADGDAGALTMSFFRQPLVVHVPDYAVLTPNHDPVPAMQQALITTYLVTADGTPRAGEWVAFRELPDGMFYHRAFTGYTGAPLVRAFGDDLASFARGAAGAGGSALTALGDAAYEFRVLPRLWLAVVYWLGDDDDEFPSQASVLFDRTAGHYMVADGLAIIGSQLVRRIIAAAHR